MIFKDKYFQETEKQITAFLAETMYRPLLELLESPLYNSSSALINAIRSGKIQFKNGVFTGSFNARISRELSKYAKYYSR